VLASLRRKIGDIIYYAVRRRLLSELERRAGEPDQPLAALIRPGRDQLERVYASTRRVDPSGQPIIDPLADALREIANMRWDIKVLASALADNRYEAGLAGAKADIPPNPTHVGLQSKLCTQADIESEWFRYWCGRLHVAPIYVRKYWEYGYVLQVLWEAGKLRPEYGGLGFAVGTEPLSSYFASQNIAVRATDLAEQDTRSAVWQATNEHSKSLDQLHWPQLVGRDKFLEFCSYQSVDMNAIPKELYGRYDFCWSMCSFEHLGSVERGIEFVRNSVKCLKPGGLAVHTTEFNLELGEETVDNWVTVLFQRRHIEELANRLSSDGHELVPVNFDSGTGVIDRYIDIPPYPHDTRPSLSYPGVPHLRLSVDGFPCTSIGLIIRAGGGV
jgi:2-polyprenyl-3-methyl-5-hydroxy-6-metoxy-1,4-benzoquinol methylase